MIKVNIMNIDFKSNISLFELFRSRSTLMRWFGLAKLLIDLIVVLRLFVLPRIINNIIINCLFPHFLLIPGVNRVAIILIHRPPIRRIIIICWLMFFILHISFILHIINFIKLLLMMLVLLLCLARVVIVTIIVTIVV